MENKVVTFDRCSEEEQKSCINHMAHKTLILEEKEWPVCNLGVPLGCPKADCVPGVVCPLSFKVDYSEDGKQAILTFPCEKCIGPEEIKAQLDISRDAALKLADKITSI